jgi:pilus assembly protein Flp/PilA
MSENVRLVSRCRRSCGKSLSARGNEVDADENHPPNKGVKLGVKLLERLVRDESGATAVEYGLILGGIAAAIIVMIYVFGDKVNNLYNNTASQWP